MSFFICSSYILDEPCVWNAVSIQMAALITWKYWIWILASTLAAIAANGDYYLDWKVAVCKKKFLRVAVKIVRWMRQANIPEKLKDRQYETRKFGGSLVAHTMHFFISLLLCIFRLRMGSRNFEFSNLVVVLKLDDLVFGEHSYCGWCNWTQLTQKHETT